MSNDKLFRFDKGGELPTCLGYFKNATGRDIPVYAAKPGQVKSPGWNINKGRTWNPALGQYPPWCKRRPIVKVRKSKSLFNLLFGWLWKWECRICYQNRLASTWEKAIEQADRHARNHRCIG